MAITLLRAGSWRIRSGRRASMIALAGLAVLGGCASEPPAATPTTTTVSRPTDRDALASLAAAAKDHRFVASYALSTPERADRTITVAIATDDSWVVAVPASALSGLADLAIFKSSDGLFQCALGPVAGTAGMRPDLQPITPGCVKVSRITPSIDPRVQHAFTDWIDALIDRASALSVALVPPLEGARGTCYSVEPTSAALSPPVDPGIYCYTTDGLLTAARVGFGTLMLVGAPAPAPPAIAQPAPTVARAALPMVAPPPPPPPSPTPTPSAESA